jgi:N-acyl amino acid synthase of PEP-CTERM/exosortase system
MTSTKKSNVRQTQSKKPASTSLSENFHRYFRLLFANRKALRRHACKIRHSVYCNELGWKDEIREQIEADDFFEPAYHCVLEHKISETYARCVPVVTPPPYEFAKVIPFEAHCVDSLKVQTFGLQKLSRGRFKETSRLADSAVR